MDFSKLVAVGNANPTSQAFDLKWSAQTEKFRWSDRLFAQMQLEYNSLTQFETNDGQVIIGVVPGNDGVFYKKQKGSAKGKTFKNAVLSKACTDAGLDKKTLTVTSLGDNGGIAMYRIVDGMFVTGENATEEASQEPQQDIADENPYLEEENTPKKNDVKPVKDEF
jgi:hypothetical protein